jgi:toxin ParE1/3/4
MAEIIWTKLAISQLEKAVKYIAETSSNIYAEKILEETFKKTKLLETEPFLGQKELNLDFKKTEYHYLIVWSYKIIYRVSKDNKKVYIARYFHTSQNPSKMFE